MSGELNSLFTEEGCRFFYFRSNQDADNEFLVHEFLNYHLKKNASVILLNLSQCFTHFFNVAKKQGHNLKALRQDQKFICLDVLKLLALQFYKNKNVGGDDLLSAIFSQGKEMQCVFNAIKETVENTKAESFVLIIDNVTLLLSFGIIVKEVYNFVHYCQRLVKDKNGLMLVCSHEIDDDEEDSELHGLLCHLCDKMIVVRSLRTGQSEDVDGKISTYEKDSFRRIKRRTNLYKVEDKAVKLFPE